jgi:hypothetical protein
MRLQIMVYYTDLITRVHDKFRSILTMKIDLELKGYPYLTLIIVNNNQNKSTITNYQQLNYRRSK